MFSTRLACFFFYLYFSIMKIKLDKDLCIGCGLCEENLPEIFSTGDYTAELKNEEAGEELRTRLEETVEDCPAEAISISPPPESSS